MKKIYSIALAAVAILSAASCQKELVNDNFDAAGEKFTVTAVASADSKTVLDGVNTYWTPGDQIVVYDATGAEATFSTDITEQAATAKFTADAEFVAPESLVAVYPKRTGRGATSYADGVISGLHIGGGQTAVAGSFDPLYAVSVGTPKAEGSTELVFNAAHCLVKFTVGGDTAPTKVTLKNNGERLIAGMYDYNLATGVATVTGGAKEISLTGNFEVGKTYYIAMTHGVCGNGISLLYDGVEMKNTGETFTAEPNKIYNLGTLPAPAEEPAVKKVTVAEFLDAAEDDTEYELTGVITRVANTTYGNFDLTDETGTVYIYGLCSPEGAQKYWAESGAKLGDTITVKTVRSSHNGSPQGKNAIFVGLVPFEAVASEWGVVGDLTSWGGAADVTMYTTWQSATLFAAYNVEITSGGFKIRANGEWNDAKNYGLEKGGSLYADKYYQVITSGGSQNITPMEYGTYDIYFDLANERVAIMTPGKAYADAADGGEPVAVVSGLKDHTWGLIGSFGNSNWGTDVATVVKGDWAVAENVTLATNDEFKFRADGAWTLNYGSACDVNVGETYATTKDGQNMKFVGEPGAYNLYFSLVDASFYMEANVEVKTLTLTNEEICAVMDASDFTYYDYTIASASGEWTVNASKNQSNTYLQCRGKKGAYIKTPLFENDIKSVTIHFSEAKSVYADNVYCVFPVSWTVPTEDAAYPEDGNVGKAVTDGSYSLTIPVEAGNKQVYISIIGTYAYYLDHIDVQF